MYDHNSLAIVSILFVALLLSIELGYRVGVFVRADTNEPTKTQINAIQASLLGVLALLLGFTFSLSLQRFDSRSEAVMAETNAIGTALLRTQLLPDTASAEARQALGDYLDLRISAGAISLDQQGDRQEILRQIVALQKSLWSAAVEAAREDPGPARTGLFLQSLNDMIDAYSLRNAALDRHVPEFVLFMLFVTFGLTTSLVGYSSGLAGHRATFATYMLTLLITSLVFIIIDLDRPRRGLIEVSQQSMLDLRSDFFPSQN